MSITQFFMVAGISGKIAAHKRTRCWVSCQFMILIHFFNRKPGEQNWMELQPQNVLTILKLILKTLIMFVWWQFCAVIIGLYIYRNIVMSACAWWDRGMQQCKLVNHQVLQYRNYFEENWWCNNYMINWGNQVQA